MFNKLLMAKVLNDPSLQYILYLKEKQNCEATLFHVSWNIVYFSVKLNILCAGLVLCKKCGGSGYSRRLWTCFDNFHVSCCKSSDSICIFFCIYSLLLASLHPFSYLGDCFCQISALFSPKIIMLNRKIIEGMTSCIYLFRCYIIPTTFPHLPSYHMLLVDRW